MKSFICCSTHSLGTELCNVYASASFKGSFFLLKLVFSAFLLFHSSLQKTFLKTCILGSSEKLGKEQHLLSENSLGCSDAMSKAFSLPLQQAAAETDLGLIEGAQYRKLDTFL